MADKLLPKGYKTYGDKTKFLGSLKTLSPAQQEIRMLMVQDPTIKDSKGVNQRTIPNIPKLKRLSDSISNGIQSQTNLRNITPYIKRAEQIWLTLLLKPNGIETDLLVYDTVDSDLKNTKLHSLLLQKVKNHFSSTYPFQDILPQIIKDVMFRTGSYALLNLPHAALDHMINGMAEVEGKESYQQRLAGLESAVRRNYFVEGNYKKAKNLGWIRKEKVNTMNDGFESLFKNTDKGSEFDLVDSRLGWSFTDNPIVLKVSELRQKVIDDNLRGTMGSESLDSVVSTAFKKGKGGQQGSANSVGITSEDVYEQFIKRMYPGRTYTQHESLSVRHEQYYSGSGRGVGIRFHIPSEACIPVHQNGDKNLPIGYILLTDPDNGYFLKTTGDVNYYSSNKNRSDKVENRVGRGTLNDVISNIKNIAEGRDCEIDMDWAIDMVNGLLEKEITESFMNGDKAVPITLSLTEANKKIYLARALKNQGVRSIFVPAEYITYFALDFNDMGIGKSLVEEAKMIITRVAILDIADTAANLANATSKTVLTMDIEEENFAPTELILQAREKYLQDNPSLLNYVGFAQIPIDRIVDGIKETLVRVKVNANDNPNIINPNFDEQQEERNGLKPVDNDSREKALNSLSSYFDLKRSWLEDSEQGNDFAIEALADQELLRNITIERSRAFSLLISDHFGKHIRSNEYLMSSLVETIMENKTLYNKPDSEAGSDSFKITDGGEGKENVENNEENRVKMVLKDFLNNLDVRLPIPTSIESYTKLVDKLEAAEKLVVGWKEIGVAKGLLERTLHDMGLDETDKINGKEGDAGSHVMGIIESVLRREAYRKLGIAIPFDEIVSDGKTGGLMDFINDATTQRDNVVTFIDHLFTAFAKTDKRIGTIAARLKKKMGVGDDENEENPEDQNGGDFENNTDGDVPPTDDENQTDADQQDDENSDGSDTPSEGENEEGDTGDNPEGDDNNAEKATDDLNKGIDFGNIKYE